MAVGSACPRVIPKRCLTAVGKGHACLPVCPGSPVCWDKGSGRMAAVAAECFPQALLLSAVVRQALVQACACPGQGDLWYACMGPLPWLELT